MAIDRRLLPAHGPLPAPLRPTRPSSQYTGKSAPSLVAVQYAGRVSLAGTNHRGRRYGGRRWAGHDLAGMLGGQIPDEQMKDFKIIVPSDTGDPQELEAVFQGRDEAHGSGVCENA